MAGGPLPLADAEAPYERIDVGVELGDRLRQADFRTNAGAPTSSCLRFFGESEAARQNRQSRVRTAAWRVAYVGIFLCPVGRSAMFESSTMTLNEAR